jgi:hypothetical protein
MTSLWLVKGSKKAARPPSCLLDFEPLNPLDEIVNLGAKIAKLLFHAFPPRQRRYIAPALFYESILTHGKRVFFLVRAMSWVQISNGRRNSMKTKQVIGAVMRAIGAIIFIVGIVMMFQVARRGGGDFEMLLVCATIALGAAIQWFAIKIAK